LFFSGGCGLLLCYAGLFFVFFNGGQTFFFRSFFFFD
jgi:hypothetical protein